MKKFFTFLSLSIFTLSLSAQIQITDADLVGGQTYNWTADNEYILNGFVYLEEGGVLNIEAGTVIRGALISDDAPTLIITRGAKINAIGTADNPIIFTAEGDDLSTVEETFTNLTTETWGGLIILGNANVGEDGGTDVIEGLPTDDDRGTYGGDNDADDSGTLRYVSIRHGGEEIGADNEINGLTLGGVGSGTTIDYVEIFASFDDGIEFFGGTVNATHVIAGFVGDDGFDFDEDWNGYVQYALCVQQDEIDAVGDNAIEYDGSEDSGSSTPVTGRIYNGTFIGSGQVNSESRGLRLKSSGALQLWNSIFVQQVGYAYHTDGAVLEQSAFASNIAFDYGVYVQDDAADALAALTAGGCVEADPGLASISVVDDQMLDPRPANFNSLAYGGAAAHNNEAENTLYRGAFAHGAPDEKTWAHGWTAMDAYGYLYAEGSTTSTENEIATDVTLAVQPNPVTSFANLKFSLPNASEISVEIMDIAGRTVAMNNLGFRQAGANTVTLNTANLVSGTYLVSMRTNAGVATTKIVK